MVRFFGATLYILLFRNKVQRNTKEKRYSTKHHVINIYNLFTAVLQFLDFTVNRVLMKPFETSNIAIIEQCRYFFDVELPSVQLRRRS